MFTDHLAQHIHNKRACDLIHSQTPSFLDWEVTMLFYSALHLIDHHLQDLGYKVGGHGRRIAAVKSHLPEMHDPFNSLYSASILARYSGVSFINAEYARKARRAYEQLLDHSGV